MKEKKTIPFLLALFVIVLGVLVWLITIWVIPKKPVEPYFPDDLGRISEIHWIIGQFQPVYLFAFEKRGDLFLKVAYRDSNRRIKLMDVYLGNINNVNVGLVPLVYDSDPTGIEVAKLADYQNNLKFGQRFLISYLRTVTRRSGTGSADAAGFGELVVTRYCEVMPRVCDAASYVNSGPDSYWNFKDTGVLDRKLKFRPLDIQFSLAK